MGRLSSRGGASVVGAAPTVPEATERRAFWRSAVLLAVIVITCAALLAPAGVLYVVHRLRPEAFKVDATVTRWASFKIEMRSPQIDDQDRRRRSRRNLPR